jgi:methanol metabolism-related c-type cytochrome
MRSSLAGALALGVMTFAGTAAMGTAAFAEAPGDPKAVKSENGKYFDAKGDPTYNVAADGTVDWYTFSGYRRYHAECHVCHGPNGGGSTYAPALKDSVKRFNYAEFAGIVIGGRQNGNSVMPAFADNKNAVCYVDDLYVYLRALSTGAIQPGRPEKKEARPEAFAKAEAECMSAK